MLPVILHKRYAVNPAAHLMGLYQCLLMQDRSANGDPGDEPMLEETPEITPCALSGHT